MYAIRRAENKLLQLETAQRLGFNIPDTTLTSDPQTAQEFLDKHQEIIVKPLSDEWPKPTNTETQPAFELRVTIVGDEVFAARVETNGFTTQEVRD